MHAFLTCKRRPGLARGVSLLGAAFLAACSMSPVRPPPPPAPAPQVQAPPPAPVETAVATAQPLRTSSAATPRDYRRYGATRVYELNPERIYKGKMPPMLYAVGVLNVDIDRAGQVQSVQWMRAPRHAPEVMAEIEKMVRAAAPYPAPQHLGQVTYTDVWLWHKSGRFQLDTLTEGQD